MTIPNLGGAVLLLGNYRAALAVARRLSMFGCRIIVSRDAPEGFIQFSRFVDECWDHPPVADRTEFASALGLFLSQRPDVRVIFPVMEEHVEAIAAIRNQLPSDRTIASPSDVTVQTCLDKQAMLKIVEELNLPAGKTLRVGSIAELGAALAQFDGPVVLKSLSSTTRLGGAKALIVDAAKDIRTQLPQWPEGHEQLLVQTYFAGPRYNLYFAAEDGRPIRYLTAEVLRTDAPDGTGLNTAANVVDCHEEMLRQADLILSALSYHGVGLLQFINDESSGVVYFLELNPRLAGNHVITDESGLDLAELAISLAAGSPIDATLRTVPAGGRFLWLSGALSAALRTARSGSSLRIAMDMAVAAVARSFSADIRATWRSDDPLPSIAYAARRAPIVGWIIRKVAARIKSTEPADL